MVQRVGRVIALLSHDRGTRRGEWSAARPGRTLPPEKTRYPFYRRLGGSQGRSGRAENLVPTGIRSRTVQPVVSCYTNWTTRPTLSLQRRKLSYYAVSRIIWTNWFMAQKNNCTTDFFGGGGNSHKPTSLYCSCYNLSCINTFIFFSLLAYVITKSKLYNSISVASILIRGCNITWKKCNRNSSKNLCF